MAPSTNGGYSKEYCHPHLRDAMRVCRLANADWQRDPSHRMRYIIVCNVHEGLDPNQPILVLDVVGDAYLYVAELLERLPEDLRKRALDSRL